MKLRITSAGPLTTLQDAGRFGLLASGISASGPMDRAAFERAGGWIGGAGAAGLEFASGIAFTVEDGHAHVGADGGAFVLKLNGTPVEWPARMVLRAGDEVDIRQGAWGNWGYLRFSREMLEPPILGSRSTNSIAGLGRVLTSGDIIEFGAEILSRSAPHPRPIQPDLGPIRVIWGLHADAFDRSTRLRFVEEPFHISARMDRMGIRLEDRGGVFRDAGALSLVSDAVVPGDIQILGDGSPAILMRDHQPTGGYPRIAIVVSADIDRLAQLRAGAEVRFTPVTLRHAMELGR